MSYEETLKSHDTLHNLITNNHINTLISFPAKSEFSDDFIDWLSPQYLETFMAIYKEHIGTKTEGNKVVKLINTPWYCNTETEDKIIDFLMPRLETTLKASKTYRAVFETKSRDLEAIIKYSPLVINDVLNPVNKALLRRKHNRFNPISNRIIDDCLDICEKLKRYKARDIEFRFSGAILNAVKNVGFNAEQQERYNSFTKKAESSIKISYVISAVIGIIALVRLIAAFV